MKHTLIGLILLSAAVFGQTFEVADVHVSAKDMELSGGSLPGGRFELHGATMLRLIMTAYGVREDKVFGGPPWLDVDRFDVIAKGPGAGASLQPMMQALLKDRFKLTVHNEDKPMPIFALTVGKRGPQFKAGSGKGEPECKLAVVEGYRTYTCHQMTMAGLAERLPGVAAAYFNHPVLDRTGLKEAYDFSFKWTGRGLLGGGDEASITVFDALDKQLGLKAEAQTQAEPAVVVDHVERTPTPNAPGVTESLPPAPTEFEAAEVRPSKPDTKSNVRISGGRVEIMALSLKDLITIAYNVEDYMVTGGEKWMDTENFDVIAKSGPLASNEVLRGLLRKLIEERFKLKTHRDQQPVMAYALTVTKRTAKLKDSDGTARSACTRVPGDGLVTFSCKNITMAQFVEKLPSIPAAQGYLDHPLVDLTGLKGAYDFDVSFSNANRVYGRGGRGPEPPSGSGVGAASTPAGGVTLFEAVDKQLGLKLTAQKVPMPVIVVDHADRTPSEN